MLIYFLSDYLRKAAVRAAFAKNPLAVAGKYGLSAKDFSNIQKKGLGKLIEAEVDSATSKEGGNVGILAWGTYSIKVTNFSPRTANTNATVQLIVKGENFTPTTKIVVQYPEDPEIKLDTEVVSDRELRADFKPRKEGFYEVGVEEMRYANRKRGRVGGKIDGAGLEVIAADKGLLAAKRVVAKKKPRGK